MAKTPPAVHTPVVHTLDDHNVYFTEDVMRIFRLRRSGIRREIRLGRLRAAKRGNRYYFLGCWLRSWLEDGELRQKPTPTHRRNGVADAGYSQS
jgi:hypothetical protein